MSDDQYFGASGKPENKTVTAMRELVAAVKDPATLHHHHYPTIGHTWTDPATGQEVMVVPVVPDDAMIDAAVQAWTPGVNYGEATIIRYTAMLASLRAKEGK
jgi:tRNA/tmRNA/rRNA uracil-C5-methylase (TrmA/RlmC/RlmD family)